MAYLMALVSILSAIAEFAANALIIACGIIFLKKHR